MFSSEFPLKLKEIIQEHLCSVDSAVHLICFAQWDGIKMNIEPEVSVSKDELLLYLYFTCHGV